jgi:hypothetical protein
VWVPTEPEELDLLTPASVKIGSVVGLGGSPESSRGSEISKSTALGWMIWVSGRT